MNAKTYQLTDILKKGTFTLNQNHDPNVDVKFYETIFLTNGSNRSLKDKILAAIRQAKSVVKICSFIITDKEILDEILKKVQDPTISIFLLTQLDKKKLTNHFALSYNSNDEENLSIVEINSHLANIKTLRDCGVHLRAAKDLHAKFIITDREEGLIMSANLTTNSVSKNVESGVLLDLDSSQDLDKLFDVVYLYGTSYRSFTNTKKGKKMFVSENKATLKVEQLPIPKKGLRYTYDSLQNNLLDEIINVIEDAKDYIFLSTYSIVGLAKIPKFITAISQACSKGVKISIFCRAMNYRLDHLEGCRTLSALGCHIYGDSYNHSKGIISDKKAMIFTANIDGNYGLLNSFEVGFILDEFQKRDFLAFHKELIVNCIFKFSSKPIRREFLDYVNYYEMEKELKPFLTERDLEIVIKKSLHSYFEDISDNLMFIGRKKDNSKIILFLNFDSNFYEIQRNGNKLIVLEKCQPIYNAEKYFLKFINLKMTFSHEQ